MNWNTQTFIDMCLPFGLHSAPKLFNILADFLSWILEKKGVSPILHYLDNFLVMGPPLSPTHSNHLTTIMEVCSQLGILLALEKLEGPTQSLRFLGITLDTHCLPPDKLQRIRDQVASLQRKM